MEYTVESRDCRLHVYDTMGDGPILLIMHGVATDGSFFRKTAEILKDSYRVISYDRRGHSASIAGEDASYTAHQQALDAAAILNRAGAGSADVAACSAGGIVALELARTCPDRVRRLFLHETPFAADEQIQAVYDQTLLQLHEAADKGRITKAMVILIHAMGGRDRKAEPVTLEQEARNLENYKIFLYHEMDEFLRYGVDHEKIELAMPCTMASGSMDSEGLFSKYVPAAAGRLGASYLRVPGYHNLAWDEPETFASCLCSAMKNMGAEI